MKEIIIDGVDVEGCRNYKHNAENIGWSKCLSKDEEHYHSNNPLCCEKKDCYYKQLKRLEQENAELKEENKIARQAAKDFVEINEAYMKYEDCLRSIKEIAEEHSTCASYDCPPMFKIINLIKESEV